MRKKDGQTTFKFLQPVLIQKLEDEFDIPSGWPSKTPAVAGQVLVRGDGSGTVNERKHTIYWSRTEICMFVMQWARPDIYNTTRGLARHMLAPRLAHMETMCTLIWYLIHTKNRGLVLPPDNVWNGNRKFKLRIHGRSDPDSVANTDVCRSVSDGRTFLNIAPEIL